MLEKFIKGRLEHFSILLKKNCKELTSSISLTYRLSKIKEDNLTWTVEESIPSIH